MATDAEGGDTTPQNADTRALLEEIASWDEDQYPLAEHAERILKNLDRQDAR